MSGVTRVGRPYNSECQQALEALSIATLPSFVVKPSVYTALLRDSVLGGLVEDQLAKLDSDDPNSVMVVCFGIRSAVLKADFCPELAKNLNTAYIELSAELEQPEALVTVRQASESSIEGTRTRGSAALERAILTNFADHMTRQIMGGEATSTAHLLDQPPELTVAASLGLSCSGLITCYEPRTGNPDFVVIAAVWGLAEDIARKELARDEYTVHKPTLRQGYPSLVRRRAGHKEFRLDFDMSAERMRHSEVPHEKLREFALTSEEALRLARAALACEQGAGCPLELDWGMQEGWSRQLVLLGSRPSKPPCRPAIRVYSLKTHGRTLVQGTAVGSGLAVGTVRVIRQNRDLELFQPGEVLVAHRTEPDWEPVFRTAAAIVTEADTRVSHSTILAREMGLPALLGAQDCTTRLKTGQVVTVACCQGSTGHAYEDVAQYAVEEFHAARLPQLKSELMVSLSMPERALLEASRPWAGAGLIRSEFMLTGWVRIHPLALLKPEKLPAEVQATIHRLCRGYPSKSEFFIDQMSQGIGSIAAAFWPRPVLLRLSDLKSHEYRKLLGGETFEPKESNPVLGWRGASRYLHPDYREAFELEIAAVRRVRIEQGLTNLHLMVPFCRTPAEGEEVLEILAESGLRQGDGGLEIWVMAELPSNVILAEQFADLFDGLSIGSNDLTQLVLGVDRDSGYVGPLFDEIDPSLMFCYETLIAAAHQKGKKVGFCGEIASSDALFAATLAEMGVDSISVAPDAFTSTLFALQKH